MARHKGLELLMAGHKGRIWKRNPGKTWGKAIGEWGVEVPANLTWIKIHSFISSARKEIVGNSILINYYIIWNLEIDNKVDVTVFFPGLTDTSQRSFSPKMSGNSFEPCFNMPSSTPWACPGAPRWALASTCEHACSSSACRMPCLSTRITKCPPGYALVNHVGHGGPLELFQPAQIWAQICGRSKHARIVFLIAINLSFWGNLWQNSLPFSLLKPIPPDRFPSIRSWGPEPPPERQRSPLPLLRFHSKISIGLDSLLHALCPGTIA